jgi:RHS repeat-associated protein
MTAMVHRRRVAAACVLLLLVWGGSPSPALGYGGTTTLTYDGQLHGYAVTWRDYYDPYYVEYCYWEEYDPWTGETYCLAWYEWENFPYVVNGLYTPSNVWTQGYATYDYGPETYVYVTPFTPAEYGTWAHHANHYQFQKEWHFDGWQWHYNEYYYAANPAGSSAYAAVPWPPPQISSLDPTSGVVGQPVTIHGTYFGGSPGAVEFNGTAASVGTWTHTQITTTVPAGATSGNVRVYANGQWSTGVGFTVLAGPLLSTVEPTFGPAGHPVTVTGTNFGPSHGSNTVTFNGTTASVTQWSSTSISVTVPAGAATGPVVVTVGGQASNGLPFTVGVEEVQHYHTDAIGSVRLVTRADQSVAARYDYLPFGQPWQADPGATETRRYAGLERSAETGAGSWQPLDYAGARYYSSQTGRFTAVDPVFITSRHLRDPQSWNRYAYALNNPARYVDPDGRVPFVLALPWLVPALKAGGLGSAIAGGAIAGVGTGITAARIQRWFANEKADTPEPRTADDPLARDEHGNPVPDPEAQGAPHTQLGTRVGRNGKYPQAREFDKHGNPVRDIDFTDHGRPDIPGHVNPHEHLWRPNPTGGSPIRGGPQPIP